MTHSIIHDRLCIIERPPVPVVEDAWRAEVETGVMHVPVGKRVRVDLPVVRTLGGCEVHLTAHIQRGLQDGPTLVVLGGMHGDETGSFPVIREFLDGLRPEEMTGTVIALPVANPLALGAMSRFTPDLHGVTDLHAVFPGSPNGTLTQKIAAVIDKDILAGLGAQDAVIDIHSGGAGGRLQLRVDFDYQLDGDLRSRTLELCRSFGTFLLHENDLAGTSSRLANSRGVPTVNVEIGGAYLDEPTARSFTTRGVAGLRSIAHELGILPDEEATDRSEPQWIYDRASRLEVNPSIGGYLDSRLPEVSDLNRLCKQGEVLGSVIDPRSLEVVEELSAPDDGFLFFTRRSGMVEAGAKVFGIARKATATCL